MKKVNILVGKSGGLFFDILVGETQKKWGFHFHFTSVITNLKNKKIESTYYAYVQKTARLEHYSGLWTSSFNFPLFFGIPENERGVLILSPR